MQHHETRQSLGFASKPIGHPTAHTWPPRTAGARIDKKLGGRVVEKIGYYRFDEANIVGARRGVWQQLGDFHPALAILLELAFGAPQRRFRLDESVALVTHDRFRNGLAVQLDQLGLEIEELELAGAA